MARNPDFLRCREERNNEGFFKFVQNIDLSSENMRALPHDFVLSFSDNELSQKMKIKTQWGRSWEVGISKNPRFYFKEKHGWEKFVRDNALGHSEFLTFTHKGEMNFTVNIYKLDGKEMMQPPQSTTFFGSSSRVKTEQREDDNNEEVVESSELTTPAQPNGRKLKLGKKTAEKVANAWRDSAGASSSSAAEFTIIFKKAYRLFHGEMQKLKDKLAVSERTAKAESQLKERLKLRLKMA